MFVKASNKTSCAIHESVISVPYLRYNPSSVCHICLPAYWELSSFFFFYKSGKYPKQYVYLLFKCFQDFRHCVWKSVQLTCTNVDFVCRLYRCRVQAQMCWYVSTHTVDRPRPSGCLTYLQVGHSCG